MRNVLLISLALALSGCATSNSKKYCETPVRDLTQDWHSRSYWCLPKGYVPLIDTQDVQDVQVTFTSESLELYTERESLQHKVRAASQESFASNQTTKVKPIVTSKQKEEQANLFNVMKKSVDLSKKEVVDKKVDSPIGTESVNIHIPVQVIEQVKNEPSIASLEVSFTKHNLDTDFVVDDITKIVSVAKKDDIVKLQGCKKNDEINSLVLGRALVVRQALKKEGLENKIVILANQDCTTDRKVKVIL